MTLGPDPQAVVAQRNVLLATGDHKGQVQDFVLDEPCLLQSVVMAALDENYPTLQPLDVSQMVAKTEVAKVIDRVLVGNPCVPVGNQRLVHLLDIVERATTELDDVRVVEVKLKVCRKENISRHFYHLL